MTETKEVRIYLRLTPARKALISEAAKTAGTTLTDFSVQATLAHAQDVLAHRRLLRPRADNRRS